MYHIQIIQLMPQDRALDQLLCLSLQPQIVSIFTKCMLYFNRNALWIVSIYFFVKGNLIKAKVLFKAAVAWMPSSLLQE